MLGALLDLILPPSCAGCGEPGFVACSSCTAELMWDPAPRPPDPPPPGLPECWSATGYDGAARRMILAYKERGRTALAPLLGSCLAGVAAAALEGRSGPVALVPVPSARAASRRRGHDHVRAVAAAAAGKLRERGMPVSLLPALRQARRVADQAGLSSTQRAANLSGAFQVSRGRPGLCRPPQGRPATLVLVDDVVTTGATLAEAARVLRAAGAEVPFAVTVAATRRKAATRKTTAQATTRREWSNSGP
ncbi:ComF family protein [Planotetraspora sp. GP83]|uniref:ComF family protein n=1 Tax=Planotetraspora sp. GP83 TaxID=3156264 RepID=UPI003513AC5E